MRKLFIMLLAAGLVFGAASQAGASTMDFHGSVTIGFGSVPPAVITSTGFMSIGTPVGSAEHHSAKWFPGGQNDTAPVVVPITDPAVANNLKAAIIDLTNTSTGQFAENSSTGGGWGGVQGSTGVTALCLLADPNLTDPANPFCPLPLFLPGQEHTNASGARGAGLAGTGIIAVSISAPIAVAISVKGDVWYQRKITLPSGALNASGTFTPNEEGYGVTAFTVNARGWVHGPASAPWSSAAQNSGVIQLISPLEIMVSLGGSTFVPGFSTLKMHFVPEPGTLLLIGSGVAGVVLLGRKRMKK
jgi:hypothetical protein